jgi:predicted Rossmann fold flavoprotein
MHTSIAIIGAGPSGMTAALHAAKSGAHVILIDANAVVGRKLLVTGSGRANLSNRKVSAEHYACADTTWMKTLFTRFGHADLLHFLEDMGVLTCSTADGWIYPISDSAQSVAAAFEAALRLAGVTLLLDHHVTAIRRSANGFTIKVEGREDITCEKLIMAAGGKAYPTLGSKGELFPSLKTLGHTVLPLVPALAPVTCEMREYRKLQGVRLDARVTLYGVGAIQSVRAIHMVPEQFLQRDESPISIAETIGNIIFTEWGLNGPGVMDLSHHISRHPESRFEVRLNFLPRDEEAVRALVQKQRSDPVPLTVIPGSSLPPKLARFAIEKVGLRADATLAQTSDTQLEKLFALITALPVQVTGVRGFEFCQVSAGGVPVTEVDPATMQSRKVSGLYLAGETLDVTGPCGGYNLQFAFSSGAVAGMAAGAVR